MIAAGRGHRNGGYRYEARVPAQAHGTDLVAWLAATWDHSDAATWATRLSAGEVALDGVIVTASRPVIAGEALTWVRPPWEEPDVPLSYAVVHQDDDLIVIDKPGGLPTVPAGGFLDHTLLTVVRARWPEATPVHRLGRGTSGLVVFATSARARGALTAALREGRVEKRYRALVQGTPDEGPIDVPIGAVPHPRLGEVFAATPGGRPARSHVSVLRAGDPSLVAVQIFTGRPHQIRIHLAAVGHPLAGDPLYEPGGRPRPDALPGDLGYHLHAWRIAFEHPGNGRPVAFVAEPPPALR